MLLIAKRVSYEGSIMIETNNLGDRSIVNKPASSTDGDVPNWISGLNAEQREAVQATEGPVLVLSGAGTGKTRVLITRLAHIVANRLAQPWQILAVTFTNRAAMEMRERVSGLVGPMAESMWLGTFHSIGVRILRKHASLCGLETNFTILDTDDQLRLIKQVMIAENIDTKKWPPQAVLTIIQRWKDKGLTVEQVSPEISGDYANGQMIQIYEAYQQRLSTLNAADFGDLLLHCLVLFIKNPDVLEEFQNKFKYILVDEYQDTNVAQYLWLRLLSQKRQNLCCVGDDDQAIYSWRGAEVGNILKFEKDFAGAKIVRLEQNYRSTQNILEAASHLIKNNKGRLGKELKVARSMGDKSGDLLIVKAVWDGPEEARWIVEEIEKRHSDGLSLSNMVILVRAGFQILEFEERFINIGLPYRVIGGPRFYERKEIRDALAYLRCANSKTDDLAFERIINTPKRGIGEATLQKINFYARSANISLIAAAASLAQTDELRPHVRRAVYDLTADIKRWTEMSSDTSPSDFAAMVLDESGYTKMWQLDNSPEAVGRLENLKELVGVLEDWDSISSFLEHVSLVMENSRHADTESVTIMTLHAAKGLEFDTVFLAGWEEDIFPHRRALDEKGNNALEEERRLAYVGITRAKRNVIISYASNRRIYNQWQTCVPSRFISELPLNTVEHINHDNVVETIDADGNANNGVGWNNMRFRGSVADTNSSIDGGWTENVQHKKVNYRIGDRIFHQKFGYGNITSVDGKRLDINFEKAGEKKVLDSFVESV